MQSGAGVARPWRPERRRSPRKPGPRVTPLVERICTLCQQLTFRGTNEQELQDGLELLFKAHFSDVTREASLSNHDRVDFLVEDVGIEVKVEGSPMQVMRQLRRYLEYEEVSEVVLVTTLRKHQEMPTLLGGKPVHVVWLSPF